MLLLGVVLCLLQANAQSYWDNIDFYTTKDGLPNNSVLSLFQDKKGFLWIGTYNGLCRYDGREFKAYKSEFAGKNTSWISSINSIAEDSQGNIWVGTRGGVIAKLNTTSNVWENVINSKLVIQTLFIDEKGTIWAGTAGGILGKLKGDSMAVVHRFQRGIKKIVERKEGQLLINAQIVYTYDVQTGQADVYKPQAPGIDKIEDAGLNKKCAFYFKVDKTIEIYGHESSKKFQSPVIPFNIFKSKWGFTLSGNIIFEAENKLVEVNCEGGLVDVIDLNPVTTALKDQYINTIVEDYSGLLWIGTNIGLFKINKNKILFSNKTSNNALQKIKHNYVRGVYSQGNSVWLGTKEGEIGRLEYNPQKKTLENQYWYPAIRVGKIDYDYTINAFASDDKGGIWAGGAEGLFYLPKGGKQFSLVLTNAAERDNTLQIWALHYADDGKLYIGTAARGMWVYNTLQNKLQKITLRNGGNPNAIWCIKQLRNRTLWAGSVDGVYRINYDSIADKYTLTPPDVKGGKTFAGEEIWDIYEDDKSIWLASTENGVTQLDKKTHEIINYTQNDGLTDNVTSTIIPDGLGNIWISTISGLNKLEKSSGQITTYTEEDGLLSNDFNFGAATATSWGELFFGTKVGVTSFYPKKITQNNNTSPRIEIINLKVKGEDYPLTADTLLQLKHHQNYLSFRFALLEFSKPTKHSFRFLLSGFEKKWQQTTFDNPVATYTNLPPGNYTFIVQGSADGKTWNGRQIKITVNIEPALWQRPVFWGVIIFTVVLITAFIVWRRIKSLLKKEREKARIEKTMAELEMKALRAQMNPHFIFNTIAAIQHYIVKEDTLQANEYLAKFAKLMRLFLESSRNNYVLLSDEIQLLSLYLLLEKLRFEELFDYEFEIDPKLKTSEIKIPSMLLQPFIENAINHGLQHKHGSGKLVVKIEQTADGEKLLCTIDDNGVGRERAGQLRRQIKPGHKSQGVKLIEERVETLWGLDDVQIEIDIVDKTNPQGQPTGTLVKLVIPLKNIRKNNEGNNS